jgi:hypothetical protein
MGYPIPRGFQSRDLVFQVGGVSDENMGLARLWPVSDCTEKYRPFLSLERALHVNNQATVKLKKRKGKF